MFCFENTKFNTYIYIYVYIYIYHRLCGVGFSYGCLVSAYVLKEAKKSNSALKSGLGS